MDTLIVQQVQFVVKAKTADERHESYWEGFTAFCKGLSVADLTDADEIRGWWSALDTAADCETASYLQGVN